MIHFCMGPTETYILVREEGLGIKKKTSITTEIHHSSYEQLYRTTEDLFTGLAEQAKLK